MILLYNLLEENRERILVALPNKIRREVRVFSDGVFTETDSGAVSFYRTHAPTLDSIHD